MSGDPSTDPAPPHGGAVDDGPAGCRAVTALVRDGMLDAELAATIWLLLEGRVPCIVATPAPSRSGSARGLMTALLDFVPPTVRRITLAGADETFAWLPQAGELGWDRGSGSVDADDDGAPAATAGGPVRPDAAILVVPAFADADPTDTWGEPARIAVRAASVGYGLAGTIVADSLESVLATFRRPPIRLSDDELSRLGVVLVLDGEGSRVAAAHYVRPLARDEHGHVQRLGPAVLATHDVASDRFEHFGWGIWPELASRVGRRAGDFEQELDRRRAFLDDLVASAVDDATAARVAIEAFAAASAGAASAAAASAAATSASATSTPTSAPSAPTH